MEGVLRIRVLGPFEVEGLEGERFGSRKARTLLKILAIARGAPVSVDTLADRVWPDQLPARPSEQIAVLVSRLRSVLGTDRVRRSDAGYALRYDWLDVDALDALVSEAAERMSNESFAAAATAARAALALVRGPLLMDEGETDWAVAERRAVDRVVARLRHVGAEAAVAVGDFGDAAELAHQALDEDPYDEAALRILMAAYVGEGRPGAALAAYEEMRKRLSDELGVDPTPETREAHTAVLTPEDVPGVAGRGDGTRTAPRAPKQQWLPGRRAQLDQLHAALARARSAGPEMVLVEGEGGIGKTRLIETWSREISGEGIAVIRGRCEELGRALPLAPVFDAVGLYLRSRTQDDVARLLGAEQDVLAPLLGRSSPTPAVRTVEYADESTGRAVLFAALVALLERLAREQAVVMVLDDLHLASSSTAEWLHFLLHRPGELPILVVGTRRPEEGPQLPPATRMALGPLDLDAAVEVVGAERAADLHERSGGNPLFLVELAAAEPGEELPVSIRDAVAARCERAGPAAATLAAAAVLGEEVDLDVLASVIGVPPITLLSHLEEGVRRHFLSERGSRFVFRHELVREALAAGTGASRRSYLHREAARVLATRSDADPLDVAYHARLGGDRERAAEALIRASHLSVERFDYAAAESLADDAVSLWDAPHVRLERARARIAVLRFDEAAEDARIALGQGAGAAALEVAGWATYYLRDFPAARRFAEDGARLADDPTLRASCLMLTGRVHHSGGQLEDADAVLTEAVKIAEGAAASVAHTWLGALRNHQGRCDEALRLLHTATATGPLPHPFAVFHLHQSTAHALGQLGRADEALQAVDRYVIECERRGTDRYLAAAQNIRGWIVRNLGASEEADSLNEEALEHGSNVRQVEPASWSLLDLAEGRMRVGDLDAASSFMDRLEKLHQTPVVEDPGARSFWFRHETRARLVRARLMLSAGEAEEAHGLALALAEDAVTTGIARYVAFARLLAYEARCKAEGEFEPDAVEAVLRSLDGLAGLEAWWLTAAAAAWSGVEAWWDLAATYAARLLERSGSYRDAFARHADVTIESLRRGAAGRQRPRPRSAPSPAVSPDRVLVTVLFTDIVRSTERAAQLGDARWRELLTAHDQAVRAELARYGGREIKSTGDGFLATFETPARAIACAVSVRKAASGFGLDIRSGVHTGEVEMHGDDLGGIGVHIAARIADEADPGQVLVSRTVVDLVAGSQVDFEQCGTRVLRGVPGKHALYAVRGTDAKPRRGP